MVPAAPAETTRSSPSGRSSSEESEDPSEPVATTEARELAAEHDDDPDRAYQTVRNWITALVEAGALRVAGTDTNDATRYESIQTDHPDAGGRFKKTAIG